MHKSMMSKPMPAMAGDKSRPFSAMNEHEQAAVAHEATNNGEAGMHQQQAQKHRQMMQSEMK
ncbi:hypothetical protein ACFSFZ_15315 [Mixta tenebrionis]|uniref:Copper-binding protein n=1 Tax=Mixta tenebrionis TaxID=2562439 RepID=A0A506VBF7_9GAMM|nr:hypothetical protein [Mixta tenebrionis]TPW43364.1 hypothetical protein FKM52_07340 [Mixta tenebrionis]